MKKNRRTASILLAFFMFFLTASHTYALNAYIDNDIQMKHAQQMDHQQTFDDTRNDLLKREKRIAPAIPWIGLGAAELLKWLGATAVLTTLANEAFTLATDIADALSNSDKEEKPLYFRAAVQYELYVGGPLTFKEAKQWLSKNKRNSVWSPSEEAAKQLAASFGGKPDGPENHYEKGYLGTYYYWHYHASGRATGHIFYGTERREGKKRNPHWRSQG